MKDIKNKILNSIESNIPFVIYKSPKAARTKSMFQQDDSIHYASNYSEKGFVFASFLNREGGHLLIPFENSIRNEFDVIETKFKARSKALSIGLNSNKHHHINLVQKAVETIRKSKMDKIVLSRMEKVVLKEIDLYEIFARLVKNNPNTFTYLWFHPISGIWMGATPETLLKIKGNKFKTMALASTQKYEGSLDIEWSLKERQEHKFVTDFISSELIHLKLEIGNNFTKRAGNLVHICTEIQGELNNKSQIKNLINTLHPTPAVCGLPKELAQQFIIKNENYKRNFYTGFLGEMNMGAGSNLFVNLRCMKIEKNEANIYIGGGITKDSNPDKEWEETVLKSEIMRSVL